MAPSDQMSAPGLPELLKDAGLAGNWVLDSARTTVTLKNRSIFGLVPVKGIFRQVSGTGTVSPTGQVSGAFVVTAASVDTKNIKRDNHLRSADFFESANYPDITFAVSGIWPSDVGITVTGMLSVRGRARPLTFDGAAAIDGDGDVRIDAAVTINRADFGLSWNFLGMVAMDTDISVHAVFTRR